MVDKGRSWHVPLEKTPPMAEHNEPHHHHAQSMHMTKQHKRHVLAHQLGSRKSPGEDTGCAHADDVCLGQRVKHARPARPDLLDPRRCARLQGRES